MVVGSAAEYGRVKAKDLPIRETLSPKPVSRYSMSMVARSVLVQGYANLGVHAMVGRLFNPLFRNIGEHFAAGSFAKQIRFIAAGKEKGPIKVGNLNAKRDFIDLEDASAAFLAIAHRGKAGEIYNVCTGRTYSMGQMFDEMIKAKTTDVNGQGVRSNEVSEVVGSMEKIANQTGWKPRVSFEESVRRMMR